MVPRSPTDETSQEKRKSQSNCIISLPFNALPFSRQHSKPNVVQLLKMAEHSSRAARRLFHSSIVSAVHNGLKSLHFLFSQSSVFNNLISFSYHLRGFRQIESSKGCKNFKALSTSSHSFAAILPGDSVAGAVVTNGISMFLNIYNSVLVLRLVLTWFPNAPSAIVTPLSTLCDPYLNIFRGIIPPLGGTLDLSPVMAFLVLNAFTNAAAALPAELSPPKGVYQNAVPTTCTMEPSPHLTTTSQEKWTRRLAGGGNQLERGRGDDGGKT
ncbi:unnamed protein product [Cuscuta europaea]|uniref:Uncharacterized protein n=1 Tax=Cuscuta europaea TaxID=41803 RepID=A0A9P0YT01_CUSEU|nr:unnamed protein product [Cuscuta europaea]